MSSLRALASLGRKSSVLVRPASLQIVPKRTTIAIRGQPVNIPPREPVGMVEKVLHVVFMLTVWISPAFYALSQIKVWRRKYLGGADR